MQSDVNDVWRREKLEASTIRQLSDSSQRLE